MSTDPLRNAGLVRTDMWCHDCGKQFVAQLDHDLEGNHELECPHCAHPHFRFIQGGRVTEQRYQSGWPTHKVERRSLWKHTTQPIQTSAASHFLRDRWLNREG